MASRHDATLTTTVSLYGRGQPRRGLNVRVCLQSCGVGGCSSGTCQWTRMADCGVAWLLRRGSLNSWYQMGSVRLCFVDFMIHCLGVTRTIYCLRDKVYWPGLRCFGRDCDVRSYIASCTIRLARKSPCPRRAPMGHVDVGHRWDRVAMDLLDM